MHNTHYKNFFCLKWFKNVRMTHHTQIDDSVWVCLWLNRSCFSFWSFFYVCVYTAIRVWMRAKSDRLTQTNTGKCCFDQMHQRLEFYEYIKANLFTKTLNHFDFQIVNGKCQSLSVPIFYIITIKWEMIVYNSFHRHHFIE